MIVIGMSCPYCGGEVEFVDSSKIYGKSFGMVYRCVHYGFTCDAYVGANKITGAPLGTLADATLRSWRKQAHAKFDPLWKDYPEGDEQHERRSRCYRWLGQRLNIPYEQCHIGMFDIEDCKRVIALFETECVIVPDPEEDYI